MAITRKSTKHGDDGLSEVIGFIIIFGIIVIVFSNYMLYGIPAQGRDSEIAHVNDIKDQFVDYKVGLDSLFNNNKVGTTISNSFTLGTGGSYSTGAISIIPMINPTKSSGTIAINERAKEYLNISSQSLVVSPSTPAVVTIPPQRTINYTPSHIYVTISNITQNDLSSSSTFGTTIRGTNWVATVNITHLQVAYTKWIVTTFDSTEALCKAYCAPNLTTGCSYLKGSSDCAAFQPMDAYRSSNDTELLISVSKNNVFTINNYPIYNNITPNTNYNLDLMDEAYGLNSFVQPPDTISLVIDKPLVGSSINVTGNITYSFNATTTIPYSVSIPLGSLEYQAQNNYWISPDYYYQLGGVFVTQADGNSTYKLPPEITFSQDATITTVNINALVIDQSSSGIVGGNSPVQIKTTLKSNAALPYVAGTANTKWIRIGIKTTDSKALAMWKNYFNYSAMAAGIPHTVSGNTTTESYITIDGYYTGDEYDINVIASNATFSPILHGIGGTYT